MSDPFLGEIKLMSFAFPPKGWALCNGQVLPINTNQALFSLLGTTYGGNGQTTFALPNLQGRLAAHVGGGLTQGATLGEAAHALTLAETPQHTHLVTGTSASATTGNVGPNAVPAASVGAAAYAPPAPGVPMAADALALAGSGVPHENLQPQLVVSYCIALVGIFPSQN